MKRLIVTGPRAATFEDVPAPACPDDGVIVEATHTAISTGTELRVFRAIPVDEAGKFLHESVPFELPAENGYSMVARITEVGSNVAGFAVGQRVFARASHRQQAALPSSFVTALPDSIPDDEAVFLNVLEVGHKALRQGDPSAGANVAIVGQGVIGLGLLAYCNAFGFRTVVVDTDESRLQIARSMGALLAISPEEPDGIERAMSLFDGEGADVVFEAASNWHAIRTAMQLARPDGRVVIVSRHTTQPHFNPVGHPFLGKRLNIITTYGHPADGSRWDFQHCLALTIDLLARRKLNIAPMITHHFDWQDLPSIYQRLDDGDTSIVGAVIRW